MRAGFSFLGAATLPLIVVAGTLSSACMSEDDSLIGIRSTDEREVVSIEPRSGAVSTLGTLGDLGSWTGETVLSSDGQRLYAFGTPRGSEGVEQSLYTYDFELGRVVQSVAGDYGLNLVIAGIGVDEQFIGLRWNGEAEEVVRIDTDDGAVAILGTMGDLTWWSGAAVLSQDLRTLYAFGNNSSGGDAQEKLYAFDLDSGTLAYDIAGSFGDNLSVAGVDAQEQLVALRAAAGGEEVIRIDPRNGAVEVAGIIAGLRIWSGETALSDDRSLLFAIGGAADSDPFAQTLFTFDLAGGVVVRESSANYFNVTLAGYRSSDASAARRAVTRRGVAN